MNEITILYGFPGSGKTTRAKEIAGEKKVFIATQSDLLYDFPFDGLELDTEYLIIDECKEITLPLLLPKFMKRELRVEKRFNKTQFIPMPKVIICIQIP